MTDMPLEEAPVVKELLDALDGKRIVEVTDNAVLVETVYGPQDTKPDLNERGIPSAADFASGTIWSHYLKQEYNPELRGISGLKTYDRMRKSDAQVRATLRLVKTPVLAARWYMEPGGERLKDETIAKFVWDNLTKWMSMSFQQTILEILLMLDYGHYVMEKVFAERDGKIIWRKLAPRHPLDITSWDIAPDGGVNGIRMYGTKEEHQSKYIPIEKLAIFSFDREAGNHEGVSVLRSAYKHWYFKEQLYKIDAIQKERHGIGIPIIRLPPNFTDQDKRLADELGRNLRTNEKAHVVLPPNWDIVFAKLEGQPVDALESAKHHDLLIARNILGQFINAEEGRQTEEAQELFLKATRYIAEIIRDVFNKYVIPQLVQYNWGEQKEYPELKVRRIGDTVDWRTISFAIRNFIGAGVITPDEELEKWIRNEMDLPSMDWDTRRIIIQPQVIDEIPDGAPDGFPGAGDATTAATRQNQGIGTSVATQKQGVKAPGAPGVPVAGLPRQSTAVGNTQGKTPGTTRAGQDRSGG